MAPLLRFLKESTYRLRVQGRSVGDLWQGAGEAYEAMARTAFRQMHLVKQNPVTGKVSGIDEEY
jgi:hypothetical protein